MLLVFQHQEVCTELLVWLVLFQVTKNSAGTLAQVENINSLNNGLNVESDHYNQVHLYGNSAVLTVAIGSGSAGLGIGVVNDDSNTQAKLVNSSIRHNTDGTAEDSVTAANDSYLFSEVADASVAVSIGAGAAGTINVSNLDNVVKTTVDNATVGINADGTKGNKAKSFGAKAKNNLTTTFATASGAAGVGAAAVGVGVNTVDTTVVTNVNNSAVYAGSIDVDAKEVLNITQYGAAAEASGVGLATNVMITNIGTKTDTSFSYDQTYTDIDNTEIKNDKDEDDNTTKTDHLFKVDLSKYLGNDTDEEGFVNTGIKKQNGLVSGKTTGGAVGGDSGSTNALSLSSDNVFSKGDKTDSDTENQWQNIKAAEAGMSLDSGLSTTDVKSNVTQGKGGSDTAEGTKVNIGNSQLYGSDIVVNTTNTVNGRIDVYQGSISGVSLNASIGVLNAEHDSGINISGSKTLLQGNNIAVLATQDGNAVQNVYQAGAGGTVVNVTYARVATSGQNTVAVTDGANIVAQGTLSVKAEDNTKNSVKAIGASVGGGNVGALITDASNKSSTTVNITNANLKNYAAIKLYINENGKLIDSANKAYDSSTETAVTLNGNNQLVDQYGAVYSSDTFTKLTKVDSDKVVDEYGSKYGDEELTYKDANGLDCYLFPYVGVYRDKNGNLVDGEGNIKDINTVTKVHLDSEGKIVDNSGTVYTADQFMPLHILKAGSYVDDKYTTYSTYLTYNDNGSEKTIFPYIHLDMKDVNIGAAKNNTVTAETIGGSLGAASAYGVVAVANDAGLSKINLTGNKIIAGTVNAVAANSPAVKAIAGSGSLQLLGSVGASVATATANGTVQVNSKNNTYLADKVNLNSKAQTQGADISTAEAKVVGVSGAGAACVQANVGTATTDLTVETNQENDTFKHLTYKNIISTSYVYNPDTKRDEAQYTYAADDSVVGLTDLTLGADNTTTANSDVWGLTIAGVVASGTNIAKTNSTGKALVNIVNTAADPVILKSLTAISSGSADNRAKADGNGGGLANVSPVAAWAKNTSDTTNKVSVQGKYDVTGTAVLQALQKDTGNINADAVGAALANFSGTYGRNQMTGTTSVNLENTALNAGSAVKIDAINTINFGQKDKYSVEGGGYGGLAGQTSSLKNTIVKNAQINVKDSTLASSGNLDLSASLAGKVNAVGTVKAAGAATFADVHVTNNILANNSINLMGSSKVGTSTNDTNITLSTSDSMDRLTVMGVANILGSLVGADISKVNSTYTRNNSINIKDASSIYSKGDLNLYAGKDSYLYFEGKTEVYNKSGIAINSPVLDYTINDNGQILIDKKASAISVGDINVGATGGIEKTDTSVKSYKWIDGDADNDFTSSNMGDKNENIKANNEVIVNGSLIAGANNIQKITIGGTGQIVLINDELRNSAKEVAGQESIVGKDGLLISITDGEGNALDYLTKDDLTVGTFDYGQALYTRYVELQNLLANYSEDKTTAAYLGYMSNLQRVQDKLYNLGMTNAENGSLIDSIRVDYISIPDLVASGGNITVTSGNLSGNGTIEAKGSPEIDIINNTNLYLKVKNINVGEAGGKIVYNDAVLNPSGEKSLSQQVQSLNADQGKTISTVKAADGVSGKVNIEGNYGGGTITTNHFESDKYYTMTPRADIEVNGYINAKKGLVTITSLSDDIIFQGEQADGNSGIGDASTIKLRADRGSVSQEYSAGITNVGGNPQDQYADIYNDYISRVNNQYGFATAQNVIDIYNDKTTAVSSAGSIIAGENIYINGESININGTLQSGYSDYVVDIKGSDVLTTTTPEQETQIVGYDTKLEWKGLFPKWVQTPIYGSVTVTKTTKTTVDEKIAALKATWENNGEKQLSNAVIMTGNTYLVKAGGVDENNSTQYNLPVYYNPSTGKLVVPDVDSNGGKIYLTGQISSTGNGTIKALDGVYNIDVTNNVASDLELGKLLTNECEGLVSITDLNRKIITEFRRDSTTYKDLSGAFTTDTDKNLSSTSDAVQGIVTVDGDNTYYNPVTGLRYNWSTGQNSLTTTTYRRTVEKGVWGATTKKDDTAAIDSELHQSDDGAINTATDSSNKLNGGYIDKVSVTDDKTTKLNNGKTSSASVDDDADFSFIYNNSVTNSPTYSHAVEVDHYSTGFFGCHKWTIYEWKKFTGTTQQYIGSVKADNPIAIQFIGNAAKDGKVSVTAAQGISLAGKIGNQTVHNEANGNNLLGSVNIVSRTGDISQVAGTSIYGESVKLSAAGNINAGSITVGDNTRVTALNTSLLRGAGGPENNTDEINLKFEAAFGTEGNVTLWQMGTANTNVVNIESDGSLFQGDGSVVTGNRINLTSKNGSVGSQDKALVVQVGQTPTDNNSLSASLNIKANKDINVKQNSGDLRVGSVVSENGDVTLTTSGSLRDALPNDGDSTESTASLVQRWKDLGLIQEADETSYYRQQQAAKVQSYKDSVTTEFATYVALKARNHTDANASDYLDPNDVNYKALVERYAGYSDAQDYLTRSTTAQNYIAKLQPDTSGWTQNELLYAIQDSIINKQTGVDTPAKAPNVSGKNITLNVGSDVGIDNPEVNTIQLSGLSSREADLKMLAQADASTVSWSKDNTSVTITEKLPIGIQSKDGIVTINATNGNVYLDSRVDTADQGSAGYKDLNIAQVSAGGNVRIKGLADILNANADTTKAAINGKNLYIDANGTLGTADKNMTVNLTGILSATGVDGVYISQISNNPLYVQAVSSKGDISLQAAGDILSSDVEGSMAQGYIRNEDASKGQYLPDL
ncbi:MAG: hypothetical protein LKE29_02720 [Acidaminococcaceae bacterium]|nr:hypothetical protein [Acidaminococcaceae bacterium]